MTAGRSGLSEFSDGLVHLKARLAVFLSREGKQGRT